MIDAGKHFAGVVTFNEALEFFEHKKAQLDYILRNEKDSPKPLELRPRRSIRYYALKDVIAFSKIINAKYTQRKNNIQERQTRDAEIKAKRAELLRDALYPLARKHTDFAELYYSTVKDFADDGERSKRRTQALNSIQKYKDSPSANNRFRLVGDVIAYIDSKNKVKPK